MDRHDSQLFADIGTETNTLADYVQALREEINNISGKGATEVQRQGIAARLEPLENRLRGIGSDPDNPIPRNAMVTQTLPGPFVEGFKPKTPAELDPRAPNPPNPVPNSPTASQSQAQADERARQQQSRPQTRPNTPPATPNTPNQNPRN